MTISNLGKFEAIRHCSSLAQSDLRQSSRPKVKYKEDFLNIFHFTLPFFQAPFKRWINNKLKVILVRFLLQIFYHILQYFIIPSLTTRFDIIVGAALRKNLRFSMPKQSDDSCLQKSLEQQATCMFLWPVKLML